MKNRLLLGSKIGLLLIYILCLLFGQNRLFTVFAASKDIINFQGKLHDSANLNVTDSTYAMTFRLYTAASGGTLLWTETWSGANEVTVTDGVFRVALGTHTSLSSVDFTQYDDIHMSIQVESDSEMTPRLPFTAVPYAMRAANATNVKWSGLQAPTANLSLSMGAYTSTFTYGATTGSSNLFNLTDTASNTGTGYLLNLTTATASTLKPFRVAAAGTEALNVDANGNVGIGLTNQTAKLQVSATGGNAVEINNTLGGSSSSNVYGLKATARHNSTSLSSYVIGVEGFTILQAAGGSSNAIGGRFVGQASVGAPNTSNVIGISGESIAYTTASSATAINANAWGISGASTLSLARGLNINSPTISGGGTITTAYGLYINSITGAGTNYAIYSAGGQSYFAGNVGIGDSSPAALFTVGSGDMFQVDGSGNATYSTAVLKAEGGQITFRNSNGTQLSGSMGRQSDGGLGISSDFSNGNLALSTGLSAGNITLTTNNTGKSIIATTGVASNIVFTVRGAASQTGNLQEWQNSGSTPVASVDIDGDIKPRNVSYAWPSANGSGVLTNDGSGNLTWSAAGSGSTAISALTAATATNTIDNTNYAQTWNWSTLTTETALTSNANSITSGTILNLSSSSTAFTGSLLNINLTGDNAANTGNLFKLTNSGTANTGTTMMITNLSAGLSFRINDQTGDADTTPFVVDASGNVGIGTASPSTILHAKGAQPIMTFENTYLTTQTWQLRNGANANGDTSFDIYNSTAATTAIRIHDTGDVLIGSATNHGGAGNNSRLFVYGGDGGANIDVMGEAVSGKDQATIELQSSDYETGGGSIYMQQYGPLGLGTTFGFNNQNLGSLVFQSSATALIGTTNAIPLIFATDNAEKMRLTSSGDLGIGTTTVSAKIHTLSTTEQLRLGYDASNYASFTTSSAGNLTIAPSGGTFNVTGNVNISGLTASKVIFTDSSKNLTSTGTVGSDQGGTGFSTYTTGDMIYASAANTLSKLGIGSTGQVLTVVGGVPTWSDAGACTTCFVNDGNSFTGLATLGTNDAYGLAFETNGTARMTISATGDISISNTTANVNFTGAGDSYINFDSGNNIKIYDYSGDGSLNLETGTGADIFINPGGNVAIGQFGSSYKLDISGTLRSTQGAYFATTSGGVGIGTTSIASGAMLHVNGIITSPGAGTNSERFGLSSAAAGANSLALGYVSSSAGDNSTAVGRSASSAGGTSLAVGYGASATSFQGTALGASATAGDQYATAVGTAANAASFGTVAIGRAATANGIYTMAIGYSANVGTYSSMVIGSSLTATANNQLLIGSGVNGYEPRDIYLGSGVTNANAGTIATAGGIAINATGGSGTNIAGAHLVLAGGKSTGSGNGGSLIFKTSSPGSTGTTLNSLTTRMTIDTSGNINIPGLSASSVVYTDASKNLTTTAPTSGTIGYWSRSGTTLSPATTDDIVSISTSSTTDLSKALSVSQTGATTGTDYAGYFTNTGAATTNIGLYATATGATNNYAAIFENGNVGIGTTTPGTKLTVQQTIDQDGTNYLSQFNAVYSGSSANYRAGAAYQLLVDNYVTGSGFSEAAGSYIRARTNNDAIAEAQQVYGIWQDLETHPSDVAYGLYVRSNGTSSTGGSQYGIYLDLADTDVTRYGIYQNSANNNYFAGNVGIGDSSPASPLTVGDGDDFQVDATGDIIRIKGVTYAWPGANASGVLTNNGSGTLSWAAGASGTVTGTGTQNYLTKWSSGGTGIEDSQLFDNGTNVGIGTNTPSSFKLEVVGNVGPSADDTYDLGSSAKRWRDLYLGPSSLHLVSTTGETSTARDWKVGINETDGASTDGNFRIMEGSNEYFTINPSGNVGIGMTPSAYKLDVNGSFHVVGSTVLDSSLQVNSDTLIDGNLEVISDTTFNGQTYIWPGSQTANGVLTTNGTGTLSWSTLGASSITADSLDFTEFQDTLDLDAALTLNQTTNIWSQTFTGDTTTGYTYTANSLTSGKAQFITSTATGFTGVLSDISLTGSNAANTGTLLRVSNSGTLNTGTVAMITNLGTGTSFRVNDETGDTDSSPFIIAASGNVGIGTTANAYKVDISNTSNTRGINLSSILTSTSQDLYGVYSAITLNDSGFSRTQAAGYFYATGSNGVGTSYGIFAKTDASIGSAAYGVWGEAPTNVGTGVHGKGFTGVYGDGSSMGGQFVNNSSTGYAAYLSQSNASGYSLYALGGRNYMQGNLGIGVTGAAYKLHVANGGVASSARFDSSSTADRGLFITTASDNGIISNRAEYNSGWIARDTTSSQIQLNSGLIRFYTDASLIDDGLFSPTERMRIDTSGNVAIGTTTTSNGRFTVNGGPMRSEGTNAGYQFIDRVSSDAFQWYGSGSGATGRAHLYNGSANIFTIEDTGNVGIMTGTPTSSQTRSLQISDSTSAALRISRTSAVAADVELGVDSSSLSYVGTITTTGFSIKSANTEAMRINTSQLVGIGTTSLSDRLHVFGDIRVGTTGTNGCLKRFDGTALTGTCSSDIRLKKDLASFSSVQGSILDRLQQLNPTYYYWRGDEHPEFGFGRERVLGLIAQDVETLFPELVEQNGQGGYKAIRYELLPFYMLQGMREQQFLIDENGASINLTTTNLNNLTATTTDQSNRLNILQNEIDEMRNTLTSITSVVTDHTNKITDILTRLDYIKPTTGTGKIDEIDSRLAFLEQAVLASGSGQASGSAVLGATATSSANLVAQGGEATLSGLLVEGESNLNDVTVMGGFKVGVLSADGIEGTVDALGAPLKLQALGSGSIEFVLNKIEMTQAGNVLIKEGDLEIQQGVIRGNDKTRGAQTITAGQTSITVDLTATPWDTVPVAINANASYDSYVWISDITATGFTINVKNAPTSNQKIYWQAMW